MTSNIPEREPQEYDKYFDEIIENISNLADYFIEAHRRRRWTDPPDTPVRPNK